MFLSRLSPLVRISAAGCTCFLLGLGVSAVVADNGSTISACAQKNNGQLRLVQSAGECRNSEIAVQWNGAGVQGPQGATGATGPQGPPGRAGSNRRAGPNRRARSRWGWADEDRCGPDEHRRHLPSAGGRRRDLLEGRNRELRVEIPSRHMDGVSCPRRDALRAA